MKVTLTCLAVGFAALVAAAEPALSGDWNQGAGAYRVTGRGATPVPAPVPIPDEKAEWYLRGDVGYSVSSSGKIQSGGVDVGLIGGFDEVDGPIIGAIGFGRYITPGLRFDVTLEHRTEQTLAKRTMNYQTRTFNSGPDVTVNGNIDGVLTALTVPGYDVHTFSVDRQEDTRTASQVLMFNLYHDINTHSIFTPYIGGGVGMAISTTKRSFNENGSCTTGEAGVGSQLEWTSPFTRELASSDYPVCTAPETQFTNSGGKKVTDIGLVAAVMAGTAVKISEGVALDVGYRGIWQGTSVTVNTQAGPLGESRMNFDSRFDHEVRTGVRIDIY